LRWGYNLAPLWGYFPNSRTAPRCGCDETSPPSQQKSDNDVGCRHNRLRQRDLVDTVANVMIDIHRTEAEKTVRNTINLRFLHRRRLIFD
jgi:hypothetical protein